MQQVEKDMRRCRQLDMEQEQKEQDRQKEQHKDRHNGDAGYRYAHSSQAVHSASHSDCDSWYKTFLAIVLVWLPSF